MIRDATELDFVDSPAAKSAAGDAIDNEGPLNTEWGTLDIPSPAFLVALYIKAFREGKQKFYEWQKEQLAEIAESFKTATVHHPYKLALCAANGSGKDYIILAPTVVWAALTNIRCLTIITSSSGTQLSSQTENYIRALCQTINEYHGQPIFRIRQRFIKCNLSGSEIRLFATDEAGKAEGYHPLEPDAKMIIVVNEAKSVSEEIFGALRRCTGYTHWLNISTPGAPTGSFYRACTKKELGYRFRRIDYTHCSVEGMSHISEAERKTDEEELGRNSALYRSKWLALFTTIDTDSLISTEVLEQLVDNKVAKDFQDWPLRIGGDIAAGGDENCVVATRGNTLIHEEAWREKDTTITADRFERIFISLGVAKDSEYIFMDDGGVGHAVIDMLRRRGWNIRRVRNEARALRPTHYGNRGAELWYNVKRLAEEKILRLDEASPKLREQLVTRCQKKSSTGGRVFLESKTVARADGRPSPDRADAYVLSFSGLTLDDFLNQPTKEAESRHIKRLSGDALMNAVDDMTFEETANNYEKKQRIYGSISAALGSNKKEFNYGTN